MSILTPDDLRIFNPAIGLVKAEAMIADALAQAQLVAPCLLDPDGLTELQRSQFRSVLRVALLRWEEAGAGGVQASSETVGPFTRQERLDTSVDRSRRGLFWPWEIVLLESICQGQPNPSSPLDAPPEADSGPSPSPTGAGGVPLD
ncbi:MAG: hypothetical protein LBL55_11430 [Propionibacteriaceae bacterium]|jgi:hypothetical protein|nr:hypothetical protein [Propionibacteriaceae bacterium]